MCQRQCCVTACRVLEVLPRSDSRVSCGPRARGYTTAFSPWWPSWRAVVCSRARHTPGQGTARMHSTKRWTSKRATLQLPPTLHNNTHDAAPLSSEHRGRLAVRGSTTSFTVASGDNYALASSSHAAPASAPRPASSCRSAMSARPKRFPPMPDAPRRPHALRAPAAPAAASVHVRTQHYFAKAVHAPKTRKRTMRVAARNRTTTRPRQRGAARQAQRDRQLTPSHAIPSEPNLTNCSD